MVNLRPQSVVTSTRAHVWYVVTEYGIANLFGKSNRVSERDYLFISFKTNLNLFSLESSL